MFLSDVHLYYDLNSNSDALTSPSEIVLGSNDGHIVVSGISRSLGDEDNAQQNQTAPFPDPLNNKVINTSMIQGQVTLPRLSIETAPDSIPLHSSNNVQNKWEDEIMSWFSLMDNTASPSKFNEVHVSVQLNQQTDTLSTIKSTENDNNVEVPSLHPSIYDFSLDNPTDHPTTNHVTTPENNINIQNDNNILKDSFQPNEEEELPNDFEDLFISRCESVNVHIQVRVSLTRAKFVPTSSFVEYECLHVCLRYPSIDFQL